MRYEMAMLSTTIAIIGLTKMGKCTGTEHNILSNLYGVNGKAYSPLSPRKPIGEGVGRIISFENTCVVEIIGVVSHFFFHLRRI